MSIDVVISLFCQMVDVWEVEMQDTESDENDDSLLWNFTFMQ